MTPFVFLCLASGMTRLLLLLLANRGACWRLDKAEQSQSQGVKSGSYDQSDCGAIARADPLPMIDENKLNPCPPDSFDRSACPTPFTASPSAPRAERLPAWERATT